MARPWAVLLNHYLKQIDDSFSLLSDIDKQASKLELPLEDTIHDVTAQLAKITGADVNYIYAFDGIDFLPACLLENNDVTPSLTPEDLGLITECQASWEFRVIRRPSHGALANLAHLSDLACIPLLSPDRSCFCMIILGWAAQNRADIAKPHGPVRGFIHQVSEQLSNAVILRYHAKQTEKQFALTATFFKNALDPLKCLDELARQAPNFLPQFGPLKLKSVPEVQILLYDADKEELRIVGTTGSEWRVTRIDVDDSFTGELVRRPEMSFKVKNPQEDDKYKYYLGRSDDKTMLHELAVPIKWGNEFVGILNLESEIPNAFSPAHVRTMVSLCSQGGNPTIAPMVYALSTSLFLAHSHQVAITSALDKHLDNVSRILRHGTATRAATIAGNLGRIERELRENPLNAIDHLHAVQSDFSILLDYIDKYRESIRGFAEITKHPIRRLINAAIEMFPKILELENIHIRLLPGEDLYVLASSLLTQHLHDLLNNAVLSVKARLATGRSEPGRIEVEVKREPAPLERQEKIGNERCRVSIWDNGLGASPEVLAQIGKPQYTTRKAEGGSGFGVFATRRYVESIHGVWLRPESTKGEFFEISFVLDVVDSLVSGGAS